MRVKLFAALTAAVLCLSLFACQAGDPNKTIEFEDGSVYVGEVVEGVPNGNGTLTDIMGSTWSGNFVNGKLNGWGTYYGYNLVEYEGYFVDGLFEGYGTKVFANGDVYKGQFVAGKMSGVGRMEFTTGCYYEGGFANDQHGHGLGWMTWPVGDAYFGEWKDGMPKGFGCKVFYDPSISSCVKGDYSTYNKYVGQMDNNFPHGEGIMYFQGSGGIYIGNWKEGQRDDDFAIYYFEPGIDLVKFEGAFSALKNAGWIWGEGTMWYSDGRVVKGVWESTTCVEVYEETQTNPDDVQDEAEDVLDQVNQAVEQAIENVG